MSNPSSSSSSSSSTARSLPSGAQKGFADGSSYDKHRPSYPSEAVDLLLTKLGLANNHAACIVDLAAGTGKFTQLLAARPEQYEVVAVEPHDGMRSTLERRLPEMQNPVIVKKGFATAIPLDDSVADGVVCAQSFHWFATTEALASIARVLKPGAGLALIWNVEDYNNTLTHQSPHDWTLKLRRLLFRLDEQSPADTPALRFRNETWRAVFASQQHESSGELFDGAIQEQQFQWTTWLDREALWSRFRTLSQIAALHGVELENARRVFDDALAGPGTEVNEQGEVAVRGSTLVVWTTKL